MKKYLILSVFLFCAIRISGQLHFNFAGQNLHENYDASHSYPATRQKEYLNNLYFQNIASPLDIVNGKEYFLYFYKSRTTPILYSGRFFNAILSVDGRRYENIKLQYDTYLDEVIYSDTTKLINFQYPKIALIKNDIGGFTFFTENDSMSFKHMKFNSNIMERPEDGFYEVVYDGPSKYIIKHQSTVYESIRYATNEYKYSPVNIYIIDNTCYKIRKKKEFFQMFSDQSQKIKEFLHRTKINIKNAGKHEISQIIEYYDSLAK